VHTQLSELNTKLLGLRLAQSRIVLLSKLPTRPYRAFVYHKLAHRARSSGVTQDDVTMAPFARHRPPEKCLRMTLREPPAKSSSASSSTASPRPSSYLRTASSARMRVPVASLTNSMRHSDMSPTTASDYRKESMTLLTSFGGWHKTLLHGRPVRKNLCRFLFPAPAPVLRGFG
jgi:hypothetical protein